MSQVKDSNCTSKASDIGVMLGSNDKLHLKTNQFNAMKSNTIYISTEA